MSEKKKNIFVRILRWLLEEWIKALLAIMAMSFLAYLGWIYRNYIKELLTSEYYLETYGWAWIGLFLLIVILSVLVFWLVTKRLNQEAIVYIDKKDIMLKLEEWWQKYMEEPNDNYDRLVSQLIEPYNKNLAAKFIKQTFNLNSSEIDAKLKLSKGSAMKYLPQIIREDEEYKFITKGSKVIKIRKVMQINSSKQRFAKGMNDEEKHGR